jgi:putative oxidoreductase
MKPFRNLNELDAFEAYSPTARDLARVHAYEIDPCELLTRNQRIVSWTCRVIAAAIMMETLFFKFTGAPESIYIFTKMAMEPWWRYGQGVWELLAATCLLVPRLAWFGGLLTLAAIGAAVVSHLTVLGIEVQGDRGLLFGMAVATFTCGLIVTWLHQQSIPSITRLDD